MVSFSEIGADSWNIFYKSKYIIKYDWFFSQALRLNKYEFIKYSYEKPRIFNFYERKNVH